MQGPEPGGTAVQESGQWDRGHLNSLCLSFPRCAVGNSSLRGRVAVSPPVLGEAWAGAQPPGSMARGLSGQRCRGAAAVGGTCVSLAQAGDAEPAPLGQSGGGGLGVGRGCSALKAEETEAGFQPGSQDRREPPPPPGVFLPAARVSQWCECHSGASVTVVRVRGQGCQGGTGLPLCPRGPAQGGRPEPWCSPLLPACGPGAWATRTLGWSCFRRPATSSFSPSRWLSPGCAASVAPGGLGRRRGVCWSRTWNSSSLPATADDEIRTGMREWESLRMS